LRDGPRAFRQDFTCPALLWYRRRSLRPPYGAIALSGQASQPVPAHVGCRHMPALNPCSRRFGLFRFRSPLLTESNSLSFPQGTWMFQFPWFPSPPCGRDGALLRAPGFPIRRPGGRWLLPPRPGLSQVAASFIVSLCQGIRRTPLVTYSRE
jgi:hypothetical protein